MDNNEFRFSIDIKGELAKIEQREQERIKEIKRIQEELREKGEKLRKRNSKHFRNHAILNTALMAVPTIVVLVVFNLIIKNRLGVDIHDLRHGLAESIGIVHIIPFIVLYFFFVSWRSEKRGKELCKALEEASKGNFDYRLKPLKRGQYKQAYLDYNSMCAGLKVLTEDLHTAVDIANEANEAKSHFLSNMSHEIRTPINAVLGLDEMIIRESEEEAVVSYAQDIKSAGKSLLGLVNDILDFSKIESGKLDLICDNYDLSSVINDLLNMNLTKTQNKGLSLITRINPDLPHLLYGDELRLKQVILNILSNAVKYTDNGHIILEMDYEKKNEDSILLMVSVQDTGKGIKEEDLQKLFTPFERIEEKRNKSIEGTGLGMSITKQLLSLMGSQLEVNSVYGKGSDFRFTVEQTVVDFEGIGNFEEAYKKLKEKEKEYHESFTAPEACILVVDDTPMNITVFKGLLKKTLLKIDSCESGKDCLRMCKDKKYDLIFVDHMMPDMDGIETLHHIRRDEDMCRNALTPVVILTANAVSGAKEGYLKEGFSDYLSKPIDPDSLEKLIVKFLPDNLVTKCVREENETTDESELVNKLRKVESISVDEGIKASGGAGLYEKVVKSFTETGAARADIIKQCFENEDYGNYTIQVHALKSSARLVGALGLSQKAATLENAGENGNKELIGEMTPTLLEDYISTITAIKQLFTAKDSLPVISKKYLSDALGCLCEVVTAFDFDTAQSIMEELSSYKLPDDFANTFEQLKVLIAEVDRDEIIKLLGEEK